MLLSVQVFAEMVKIETGGSDIKDKLVKVGAQNMGKARGYTPDYVMWILSDSNITADIVVYNEDWVESIYVWDNADLKRYMLSEYTEFNRLEAETKRLRVRSVIFDTETKSIQVEKISGTIHIEIGETNVIEKLKKVGASDLWNGLQVINLNGGQAGIPKNKVWGLSGTNNDYVQILAPDGRVTEILFWNVPVRYKSISGRNVQGFTYNADDKTLQIEEKKVAPPADQAERTGKPSLNITTKPTDPTQPNPK